MAKTCCLAGIEKTAVPLFRSVLRAAGLSGSIEVARLEVAALGALAPDLLVCDVDGSDVDALELLRRIRFVLPDCVIGIYTGVMIRTWCVACHLAGVNCVLSKDADQRQLVKGVRGALRSGCYTDPRFTAA